MDDLLDDSTNVPVFLGIVEGTELGGSLAGTGVCLEDGGFTLPLCLLKTCKQFPRKEYALSNKWHRIMVTHDRRFKLNHVT